MADVQQIDKISMTDQAKGKPAELTIHYRECYEPSEVVVNIEDVENGDVTFFVATDEETFDIVNNKTIINLTVESLQRVIMWYAANTIGNEPLPTQKV